MSEYNSTTVLTNKFNEVYSSIEESMRAVGGYLLQAIEEEAFRQGGETFASNIIDIAAGSNGLLPNPEALKHLQSNDNAAGQRIMQRLSDIQDEVNKQEIAESRKHTFRKYGRALLDGITSMTLAPRNPR